MAKFSNFSSETIDLLSKYIYEPHFFKRRSLRKKIYDLELPKIRIIVINNFDTIIQKIYDSENSRIYINTADYLLSSRTFSHKKFQRTIDPRSLKNNLARAKYRQIFEMFLDEKISVFQLERKIRNLSIKERAFICHVSGINLEIFNILEDTDRSKKSK